MALIKCPKCDKEISDQANACPKCGCPVKINKTNKDKVSNVLCLCGFAVSIMSFFMDYFGIAAIAGFALTIIGALKITDKYKPYAVVGIIFSGIVFVYRIILLIISVEGLFV